MLSGCLVAFLLQVVSIWDPVESSYSSYAPYRYGERTYGLRVLLLKSDYPPENASMLRNTSFGWFLQDKSGKNLKFDLQGLSIPLYQGPYVFARTEDFRWHKFENNTIAFAEYVSKLPIEYDDIKALMCASKEWFVRNNYGEWRKFVRRGEIESIPGRVWGMDEDGLWYVFKIDPPVWRFRAFLIPIPAAPNYLNYLDALDVPEQRLLCQDDDKVMRHPCAPPTYGLREILTKRRLIPVEDSLLTGQNDTWYVQDQKSGLKKIVMQGFGLEKNEYYIYARSEDKVWHKFRRVPRAFTHFLATLPRQHDRSEVVFDSKDWYGREKLGSYGKITLTDLPLEDVVPGKTSYGTMYDFYKMPELALMLEQDKNGSWCVLSMAVEDDSRKLIKIVNSSSNTNEYLIFVRTKAGPVFFVRNFDGLWHKLREVPKILTEFVTRLRKEFGPNGIDFLGKTWVDQGYYMDFTVKLRELTAADVRESGKVNGTQYDFYTLPQDKLVPMFYNITNWKRLMWSHVLRE